MHITPDISIGALITWFITVCGGLIVIGKTMQLMDVLTKDVASLKEDAVESARDVNRRFENIQLTLADAAVKNSAIAATLTSTAATLATLAAERSSMARPRRD